MLEVLRQIRPKIRWRLLVLAGIAGLLLYLEDYRPDAIGLATAPYRFGAVAWELGNLPDKWLQPDLERPKEIDLSPEPQTAVGGNGRVLCPGRAPA